MKDHIFEQQRKISRHHWLFAIMHMSYAVVKLKPENKFRPEYVFFQAVLSQLCVCVIVMINVCIQYSPLLISRNSYIFLCSDCFVVKAHSNQKASNFIRLLFSR